MSVFVKICGMCSAEDVAAVARMGPDALGFVFWSGSPRCVRAEDVAEWTAALPAGILKVGVFVDADEGTIADTVRRARLDVVQRHGFQSLEKERADFPISGKDGSGGRPRQWGVVHMGRNEEIALQCAAMYDAFVADSFTEKTPGGTGRCCDWEAARRFVKRSPKPVLLAGGLTPDNVRRALAQVRPWGVDVSSGVERKVREKDLGKVERFINECRQ